VTRPFVHLHLHTEFSIVDSTVRIPRLMARAVEFGMPAVGLTDQSNLFGLVKFYRKAFAAGVKPVIGVDLRIRNPEEDDRPFCLVLLCQDLVGYRNLTRLVSRSSLEGQERGVPLVNADWLDAGNAAGLIALSGGMNGDIGRALSGGHPELASARLDHWKGVFDDRFYLEVTRMGRPGEESCLQDSKSVFRKAGRWRMQNGQETTVNSNT
jgi:DNA polymerase-3 subunit alpha